MRRALDAFDEDFARWHLHLPADALATRRGGQIREGGWSIRYNFGQDARGEFLDYYASPRDVVDDPPGDDWHVRLYETGERVTLPTVLEAYMYSRDPTWEELERTRRHYVEQLARAQAQTPRPSPPVGPPPPAPDGDGAPAAAAPLAVDPPEAPPSPSSPEVADPDRFTTDTPTGGEGDAPSAEIPYLALDVGLEVELLSAVAEPPASIDAAPGPSPEPPREAPVEGSALEDESGAIEARIEAPTEAPEASLPLPAGGGPHGGPEGVATIVGSAPVEGLVRPKKVFARADLVLTADVATIDGRIDPDAFKPWWFRSRARRVAVVLAVIALVAALIVVLLGRRPRPDAAEDAPSSADSAATDSVFGAGSAASAASATAAAGATPAEAGADSGAGSHADTALPTLPSVQDTSGVPRPLPAAGVRPPSGPDDGVARPVGPASLAPIQSSATARGAGALSRPPTPRQR